MNYDKWVNGSCNGHELSNICGHEAKTILKGFCKAEMVTTTTKYLGSGQPKLLKHYRTPAAHYVFSVGSDSTGAKLAAYIEAHTLGRIATLGKVENKKYHPGRMCQMWIWAPDKAALVKWWETITEVKPTPKPRTRKQVVAPQREAPHADA